MVDKQVAGWVVALDGTDPIATSMRPLGRIEMGGEFDTKIQQLHFDPGLDTSKVPDQSGTMSKQSSQLFSLHRRDMNGRESAVAEFFADESGIDLIGFMNGRDTGTMDVSGIEDQGVPAKGEELSNWLKATATGFICTEDVMVREVLLHPRQQDFRLWMTRKCRAHKEVGSGLDLPGSLVDVNANE